MNSQQTLNLVRENLATQPILAEKRMFNGTCFMVDNKMCICVTHTDILCRIGEQQAQTERDQDNCRQMINNGRIMKDFVFVDLHTLQTTAQLQYWINLSLQYNPLAKSSKKR